MRVSSFPSFRDVSLPTTTPTDRTRASTASHQLSSQHAPSRGKTGTDSPYERGQIGEQVYGTPDGAADLHGEDLASLVRALGYSKARIVAHSSGAHAALFLAAVHPDMVVALALNEPPASGVLNGLPDSGDIPKELAGTLAPAREALKAGDVQRGIPLFVNAVDGPGAYERRSDTQQKMNMDNVASYQADATTKRPRPVFTCDMAKAIAAPTLLSSTERSPRFFHRIVDQLERCLPNHERSEIAASSHTAPWENPDAYDPALLAFMAKH